MNVSNSVIEKSQWEYYQHCYIRTNYEIPLLKKYSFSDIEKEYLLEHEGSKQKAFFAQYITEFDVPEQTQWWFTIKDNEYDITKLQSKKRYEITKAHKYCKANEINPIECLDELFDCYKESFKGYPERYKPKEIKFEDFEQYIKKLYNNDDCEFFATYLLETGKLIGFLILTHKDKFIRLTQQKTNPDYEKYNSNASLIDYVLMKYNEKLKVNDIIFTNGSRSIKHETNFNSYLEKYFGFRKAYAKLHIVYRFPFAYIIKLLKPFRKLFENTNNSFLYNFYCVLKMDSYSIK